MNTDHDHPPRKSRWKLYLTIVTLVALGILIYSLRHDIAGVISNLRKVHSILLLLLLPIEALNYYGYARLYQHLFKTLGDKVNFWPMFRLNLELNFVNHVLPSGGVSGVSYFRVRMRGAGVSGAKATLAQVMKFFLLFSSFQPLLIIGLFLLAARGHTNNLLLVVASSLITLLVIGTLLGIYVIESEKRINTFLTLIARAINKVIHFFRPNYPETINIARAQGAFAELHQNYVIFKSKWRELKMPFIYMTLANITEIAAVYVVYAAFGELVNVGAVILAYAVANFAGLISVLPAGIGIYEGLMTGVLAASGIPAEVSIPVTIMYRVVNMTIQLAPGYGLYQRALRSGLANGKI